MEKLDELVFLFVIEAGTNGGLLCWTILCELDFLGVILWLELETTLEDGFSVAGISLGPIVVLRSSILLWRFLLQHGRCWQLRIPLPF